MTNVRWIPIFSTGTDAPLPRCEWALDGGIVAGVFAYTIWGIGLVYVKWLEYVPALEITAQRVIWALVFVALWISIFPRWHEVGAAFRSTKELKLLLLSATFCGINWLLSAVGVLHAHVMELSFGYFFAPISIVVAGKILLRERITIAQFVAAGLASLAVAVQATSIGSMPWLSLAVGLNWTCYAYTRKKCTAAPIPGFFVECLLLSIPAIAYVWVLENNSSGHFLRDWHTRLLLIGLFSVTAIPLMCFATATRKLRLVTMGFLQYISPSLSFITAVTIFHERASSVKIISFPIVWLALTVFAWDAVQGERRRQLSPNSPTSPLVQHSSKTNG
jgi:chloramphenicol-sensitive protein RarD